MKLFLFGMIILLMISSISAAGVATPYWEENPLKLAPGESTTVTLSLQNMVGNEDMLIEAEISDDAGGLSTIIGSSEYSVPLGSEGIPVKIKVEIPKNAKIGDVHIISLSFQQISSGEGGMLHVAGAFTSKIPVEIVGSAESELYGKPSEINPFLLLILLVIFIISTLIVVWKIRKNKKSKTKSR